MDSIGMACSSINVLKCVKFLLNPNENMAIRPWFFNFLTVISVCLLFAVTVYFFWSRRLTLKEQIVRDNFKEIGREEDFDQEGWNKRWEGYLSPSVLLSVILISGTATVLGVLDLRSGPNILTMGALYTFEKLDPRQKEAYTLSLVAFQWGFVGAFVYAVQDLVRRVVRLDLTPRSLFVMSVRIVVASIVALVVQINVLETNDPSQTGTNMIITVIAFSLGMFPQRGLYAIEQMAQKLMGKAVDLKNEMKARKDDLPLTLLNGVSSWDRARLREEGIDTVRDLADTSMPYLLLYTPFHLGQIKDWKDQAELICFFDEDDVSILRSKAGIYHASQFVYLTRDDENQARLHRLTELSPDLLLYAHDTLAQTMSRPENAGWRCFPLGESPLPEDI